MLVVHLVSVAFLAGVGWLVQVLVYPSFRLVGAGEWAPYHRRHTDRVARVVAFPWAAQGASVTALLVAAPSVPVVGLAGLAAVTVLLTVAGAVPVHGRIATRVSDGDVARLLRMNLVRTLAWTASTVIAGVLLLVGSGHAHQ